MKRVLAVDDSKAMRLILSRSVRGLGLEMLEAADAKAALSVLRDEGAPDLILLDWKMPGVTGLDLLKALKKPQSPFREVPVIMVTTVSRKPDVFDAVQAGAADYVMKPFEDAFLQQKICRVLDLPMPALDE